MRWRAVSSAALAAVALLLVGGCTPTAPADLARRTAPPDPPSDPARPCATRDGSAGAAAGGGGAVTAAFDRGANTIRLTGGTGVSLPALRKAVGTDAALRQTAPGEWLLSASIEIDKGASLTIATPDVTWLKLRSVGPDPASIKALGGGLAITGSCVTSWNDTAKPPAASTDFQHPRSYLLARDGATMTVDKAQLSYLGYGDRESYGLSWRTGSTGHLAGSMVSYNNFGVYTYKVDGLAITGNDIHDNAVYGVDPHTDSHKLKITDNTVHDNGKHGIILAERCTDSEITGNVVYRNQHHGIVLYQDSDNNVVENNDVFLNAAQGVNVNQAKGNTIRNNRAYDNEDSGIGIGSSGEQNSVTGNDIRGNKTDGIRLVTSAADTDLSNNLIGENVRYGVYIDTEGAFTLSGNTIWKNKAPMLLKGATNPNQSGNTIFGNQVDTVKTG